MPNLSKAPHMGNVDRGLSPLGRRTDSSFTVNVTYRINTNSQICLSFCLSLCLSFCLYLYLCPCLSLISFSASIPFSSLPMPPNKLYSVPDPSYDWHLGWGEGCPSMGLLRQPPPPPHVMLCKTYHGLFKTYYTSPQFDYDTYG